MFPLLFGHLAGETIAGKERACKDVRLKVCMGDHRVRVRIPWAVTKAGEIEPVNGRCKSGSPESFIFVRRKGD